MRVTLTPKTVRRLLAADGYLDLGLPQRAVDELEKIAEPGPLAGPRELLHGIAQKQLDNHPGAISHLEKAARLMPAPVRRFAWRELAESYRAVGSEEMAELAMRLAGPIDFQLRITLPNAEICFDSTSRTEQSEAS